MLSFEALNILTCSCCAQDLELPPESTPTAATAAATMFVAPSPGLPPRQRWLQSCTLAPEVAAAGDFEAAFRLLHRCGSAPLAAGLSPGACELWQQCEGVQMQRCTLAPQVASAGDIKAVWVAAQVCCAGENCAYVPNTASSVVALCWGKQACSKHKRCAVQAAGHRGL